VKLNSNQFLIFFRNLILRPGQRLSRVESLNW
jgi:hypothetical protein